MLFTKKLNHDNSAILKLKDKFFTEVDSLSQRAHLDLAIKLANPVDERAFIMSFLTQPKDKLEAYLLACQNNRLCGTPEEFQSTVEPAVTQFMDGRGQTAFGFSVTGEPDEDGNWSIMLYKRIFLTHKAMISCVDEMGKSSRELYTDSVSRLFSHGEAKNAMVAMIQPCIWALANTTKVTENDVQVRISARPLDETTVRMGVSVTIPFKSLNDENDVALARTADFLNKVDELVTNTPFLQL